MGARVRSLIAFPCAGETLAGTLDAAPGATGLLIVSGGNELRMGAHRGMALLAAEIATAGHPVFRFDRRGIGDSTGENRGFERSADDIAAAAAAFRAAQPQLTRLIGFGNCDAATALALFHRHAGLDALVLANPWVVEPQGDLPPPAAIRAHYAERLRDPQQWLRLLRGGVNIGKLFKGLKSVSAKPDEGSSALSIRFTEALKSSAVPATILLARGDNTAIAFHDAWVKLDPAMRPAAPIETCDTDSHSFARAADKAWLKKRLVEALRDSSPRT